MKSHLQSDDFYYTVLYQYILFRSVLAKNDATYRKLGVVPP